MEDIQKYFFQTTFHHHFKARNAKISPIFHFDRGHDGRIYHILCVNNRTRAIISRGLYIFYPIFKDHFFVFKEVFSENSVLMYGLYSRAACNQERLMMARVRYTVVCKKVHKIGLYGVKWPQEKQACHSHDDATPLSFQLQVTEDFF